MSRRTVTVEFSGSFDFVIDDEAVSTWDGSKILEVLEKRGAEQYVAAHGRLYTEDATLEMLLGDLGWQLCVENRDIDRIDGWADFPREAASGNPYGVYRAIDNVSVGEPT